MNIFIDAPFSAENMEIIRLAAKGCEFVNGAESADIYIGEPKEKLTGERLKLLQLTCAGAERFRRLVGDDVIITNATGAFGEVISEYVMGAVLYFFRELYSYRKQQESRLWRDIGRERMICGSRALILGCGDIGGNTAKRLKAFGAHTVGIRRVPRPTEYFDEVYGAEVITSLLPRADIVVCCLPATPLTVGMIDSRAVGLMKRGAVFVNVGRGSVVDQNALSEALISGRICAALDVFESEPLCEDSPLWGLPNVLVTPHISGRSFGHSEHTERLIADICGENIKRFLAGEKLLNIVDRSTGYAAKG